ncbi:MAG: ACP S-malonyltransferase [Pseudomonadota bacterium]
MAPTAFLFPGQGSQFVGMGRDFAEALAWARELFSQADEITGKPITRLCFEGPLEELTLTVNLQPAITAVNLVCCRALREKGLTPDCVAGHSLGEYSALAVAGVISEAEALRLTDIRGRLMHRDALARPGAMQAVVGLTLDEVEAIAELARDRGIVTTANHNTPTQIVITGESQAVAAAAVLVKTKGGQAVPLAVSGAWHSPLMENAARDFAVELSAVGFKAPKFPVFLNVAGRAETDPDKLKEAMIRQIVSPVKWSSIVENMLAAGVSNFVEVGPRKVLSGLVKKTVPRGTAVNLVNVENMAGVDSAVEKLGS